MEKKACAIFKQVVTFEFVLSWNEVSVLGLGGRGQCSFDFFHVLQIEIGPPIASSSFSDLLLYITALDIIL